MDIYVIAETPTSTWHYHIRRVGKDGVKLGGGAGSALCGTVLGWDTQTPFSAYNTKDHIRSTWCQKCWKIYKEKTK